MQARASYNEEEEPRRESPKARTRRENRKAYLDIDEKAEVPAETEQIKINLNGRAVEEEKGGFRKKLKHEKDDIVPLKKNKKPQ